jgi:hypothetical protein
MRRVGVYGATRIVLRVVTKSAAEYIAVQYTVAFSLGASAKECR